MHSQGKRPGCGSHVKRVDHGDAFNALTGHYFILKFDLSWGIRTKMGITEGICLNLQCDCHRVESKFIKRINHYTNFSTLQPYVTALWINGVSLNSRAHTFFYRTHRPIKQIAVIISNKIKDSQFHQLDSSNNEFCGLR